MKKLPAVTAILFNITFGISQQTPEIPSFRVTSSRIVFEFIAVDKKTGRFVNDLSTDDIELRVDGKKQKIDFLLAPGQASYASGVRLGGPAAAGATRQAGSAASSATTRPVSRTVILLDTRVLDSSNFHHSVTAVKRFIDESLKAGQLVMIAEIDRGLEIVTPFTDDRQKLLEAVGTMQPASVYNPLDISQLTRGLGEDYLDELQKQVAYLRSGLGRLGYMLSSFPGRKHVVFFSEGYPTQPLKNLQFAASGATALNRDNESRMAAAREVGSRKDPGVLSMLQEIVALSNSFGVSFYTVDARGLVGTAGIGRADESGDMAPGPGDNPEDRATASRTTGSSEDGATEVSVTNFQLTALGSLDEPQNALVALAGGTNGAAFFNSNDLSAVLHASVREQDNVYLGSFVPDSKGKDTFHKIKVETSRKDVLVRSQLGYQDLKENEIQNRRLGIAFESPELFQQLEPLLKIEPARGKAQVVIGIPGSQVSYRRSGDKAQIEILFVGQIYNEKGEAVSKDLAITRGFRVDLNDEQLKAIAQQPLLAQEEIKLAAGRYKLVLVAEDRIAGTLGTTTQTFQIN